MAGDLRANYEAMGGAVSTFNNQHAQFEQSLAQISATIQNLGASWVGDGFTSFQEVSTTWHAKVKSLNDTLDEISRNVNKGSGTYQETDHGIAQTFNAIGGSGFGRG